VCVIARRSFLRTSARVALGVVAAPLVAPAAPATKTARIGLLSPFSPSETTLWHEAFRQSLRTLGWVEGTNLTIDVRHAHGRESRVPGLIADLLAQKIDLLVTSVTSDSVVAKKATRDVPIVMVAAGDPVATGLVESLAHPGGNITGLSQMNPELVGKRLELLKTIVPKLSRVSVFWNPKDFASAVSWKEIQTPARELGLQLHSHEIRSREEIDPAFERARALHAGAVAVMPNPVFVTNLKHIADRALARRLASIFHLKEFVDVGGLISYGADRTDLFRRAAVYVDKILKGAKPGDLPIEQPTKFELAINVKTARALGLTIPQALLLRAEQVVQ
jgi:ABC-type uncharacterized transport system substrate-binding protein